jgi:hypothetical protein
MMVTPVSTNPSRGKERAVNVDGAARGKIDDCLRQYVAVRDDDGQIGRESRELGDKIVAAWPLRLQNRNSFIDRDLFHRRRLHHRPRAPDGPVGLRHCPDDFESLANESAERGRRELRRAPEEHAHYSELIISVVVLSDLLRR